MRLNIHDFSGHPFQVQLSRELARRGHEVLHSYSTQYVTGHGRLEVEPGDPVTLRIKGVTCARPMIKYSPVRRAAFERAYADALGDELERERFDLVVACNIPLFSLDRLRRRLARLRQPWVLWHQDLYSLGVGSEVSRLLPGLVASGIRRVIEEVEVRQVRDAASVVAIADSMLDKYKDWGVDRDRVEVIPNWAPLADIAPGARDNAWARRQSLPRDPIRLMYAGTLGRKHNPLLLLNLLDKVQSNGLDAILVVASEGDGVDQLVAAADARPDVRVVGYQPADELGDMLASADVTVALLEPDAAHFSVPSKVLSYLSAGRPIIALVPAGNPAARDVERSGGFVAEPTVDGVAAAATWLASTCLDKAALTRIGTTARAVAERRFDIELIADSFERVFAEAVTSPGRKPSEVPR